ncbi:MAG: DUF2505 domain-containing protein [Nocardioides sp.]
MTTRLDHALTYDAPLADVAAMLADPAFRQEVCVRTGTTRHDVSIEGSGAGMHVSIDQAQSAAGIPSYAKKLVGNEIRYVQVEEWSAHDHARVNVAIPGKPGEMAGTIALVEGAGTTTETVTMDIRVGIPLAGGKIESLVADMLRAALEIENTVGRDYLSR